MNNGEISGNIASSSDSYSRGGGVYVQMGTFTMHGGEISGNTISGNTSGDDEFTFSSGGGVFVYGWDGTFIKTNGTIYGYNSSDTTNNNVVKDNSGVVLSNRGHAVYVEEYDADYYNLTGKRRETTAGPTINLDSSKDGAQGGWEN